MEYILERIHTYNGYKCSCCREDDESANWIEVTDILSFEEIVDEAFNCIDFCSIFDGGTVGHMYEADGNPIYGYDLHGHYTLTLSIVYGNEEYIIYTEKDTEEKIYTKEEVLHRYKQLNEVNGNVS